jgi:methyl-accepting chemotaxis protein
VDGDVIADHQIPQVLGQVRIGQHRWIRPVPGGHAVPLAAPVQLTGWSVGLRIPVSEFMAPIVAIRRIVNIVAVLFVAAALGVFVLFSRAITGPLTKGVVFAESVARCDLSATIDVRRKDELGALADALRAMISQVSSVIASVRGASDNVASGSEQMSSTAQNAKEGGKAMARTVQAMRKIAELSTSSVEVAETAGEMISGIIPDIRKTAELVQEISASSKEQNSGAHQINQALGQLDQVVQQNASASEEMASMSEELNGQAEQLQNTIAFFRVNENGGDARVRTAPGIRKASPVALVDERNRGESSHALLALGDFGWDDQNDEFESF